MVVFGGVGDVRPVYVFHGYVTWTSVFVNIWISKDDFALKCGIKTVKDTENSITTIL
jgi:hypothetical protein